MNPIKFDYIVDPNHVLLRVNAPRARKFLETQCPIKTLFLTMAASRASSAALLLSGKRYAAIVSTGHIIEALGGYQESEADLKSQYDNARLFLAVTSLELATRYENNELAPELHGGPTEEAVKWAEAQVANGKLTVTETDAPVGDVPPLSEVNQSSDGIA